jgi:hypothetical protein
MKKVILKPNIDSDLLTTILDEVKVNGRIGVYNRLSSIDTINEINLLAGIASYFFQTDSYCLEMDEKALTMFVLKYADSVQKVLPEEIEPALLEKCRAYLKMNRHMNELSNALSDLQSAESDLAYDYEEITGGDSHMYTFSDLDIEEYRDYYSLRNSSIREVFEELLN